MKYKIFTNDRSANEYSCFREIRAEDLTQAQGIARKKTAMLPTCGYPLKVVVIPADQVEAAGVGDGIDWNLSPDAVKEFIINASR